MNVPGMADALSDPEMLDRADREAERLLDKLKEKVQASIRDVGTLRKEMTIRVPAEVINGHVQQNLDDIRNDAVLPGFRKGRAPVSLIRRRFRGEVRDSLKTTILGQSFFAIVQNEKLDVLGDPVFQVKTADGTRFADLHEAIPHITLPDDGDLEYVCEVEVRPNFELPKLDGIEIKDPRIEITDEHVTQQIERRRKIRGRQEPCTEGAGDPDDTIVADVTLKVDGATVKSEENVQLGVRPTRLDGIPLLELEQTLRGVKPGSQCSAEALIPDDYERPDLRGKTARFEFTVHEVKRLVPQTTEALMEALGCKDEGELRQSVREDLEAERDRLLHRARKEQVLEYLLKNTDVTLPEKLSARQTDRAVMRRVIELRQNGVPDSEIEARIDELRTSAGSEAARDLRLLFVLDKVAEKLALRVTDEEVNTEIARIARLYGQRFDRVRDDLQARGLLLQLAEQIRQDKCVEQLLKEANRTEVQGG